MRVVSRVIKPGDGLKARAGREFTRVQQFVTQLPKKVVANAEECLFAAVRLQDVVVESLASQVHMREEAQESGVIKKRSMHFHSKVVYSGWNQEVIVRELKRQNTPADR